MTKTSTSQTAVLAWHFTADTLRDGSPIPALGKRLQHHGTLEVCASGLHGSQRLIDALNFAPGPILHRTEHGGKILYENDKLCSSTRTILWSIDATALLRQFARLCALDVAHLWDIPAVARQFLETGDEELRASARASIGASAWASIGASGWAGAWASESAAKATAGAATWATARDGARDAALAAARAARTAARDAARAAQNDRLIVIVMGLGCPQ